MIKILIYINLLVLQKKKFSLKSTKNNLLYPIENYYQANIDKKIHIINLAKYEFDPSNLKDFKGNDDIGLAIWNYNIKTKQFDNLKVNLNGKEEYFKGNKIITKKESIFEKPNNQTIHTLLFSLSKEDNVVDINVKKFLQKKRKRNELYNGNFSELNDNITKRGKKK